MRFYSVLMAFFAAMWPQRSLRFVSFELNNILIGHFRPKEVAA